MKKILLLTLLISFSIAQTPDLVIKAMDSAVKIIISNNGKISSIGSGFIIDTTNKRIATNYHVVKDLDGKNYSGQIKFSNGLKADIVKVFSFDPVNDVAILQVESVIGNAVEFSSSSNVGDTVYVIGAPENLDFTLSDGIISGDRDVFWQITSPISHGSSGGPVLNKNGQVIGMSTATIESGQNLNFAIKNDYILKTLHNARSTKITDKQETNNNQDIILLSYLRSIHTNYKKDYSKTYDIVKLYQTGCENVYMDYKNMYTNEEDRITLGVIYVNKPIQEKIEDSIEAINKNYYRKYYDKTNGTFAVYAYNASTDKIFFSHFDTIGFSENKSIEVLNTIEISSIEFSSIWKTGSPADCLRVKLNENK